MNVRVRQFRERMLDLAGEVDDARALLTRIHAAMIRCRWNEPTGMDEGKDSALNLEREVREWLGVKG